MIEIALDEEAGSRPDAAAPLELLTRIPALQPFPLSPTRMSRATWDQLWRARERGLFSRRGGDPASIEELTGLGLISSRGTITSAGARLVDIRATSQLKVSVTAESAGGCTRFTAWYSGSDVLVAAEVDDERGVPIVSLHQCTSSTTIGLLLSWMRLGPAWTFPHDIGVGDHDAEVIRQRIDAAPDDAPAVPADASWATARAWRSGAWARITASSSAPDASVDLIRTGDMGWFRPGEGAPGRIRLDPVSTSDVVDEVLRLFFGSLNAVVQSVRPGRLYPSRAVLTGTD
jgi:hypothetical protein